MLLKSIIIIFIFVILPLFCARVETLKNLLSFAVAVSFVALLIGLVYRVEYFPIFILLVYVGAVVVTSLFVSLTLDLRTERNKNRYHPNFFKCVVTYFVISPIALFLTTLIERLFKLHTFTFSRLSVEQAALRCLESGRYSPKFCNDAFNSSTKISLTELHTQATNDLAVISSNFYSHYAVLFIVLTILLTIALFSSLSIVKKSKKKLH